MKYKDIKKNPPTSPGVYFFLGPRKKILYIGKAGSLRDRVRSYFAKDIFVTRGAGIEQMIREARDVSFQKTDSVLEALILEAELIKKHAPKYNVRAKDDKSFNYVVVTDEDFPVVKTVRGKDLHNTKEKFKKTFGPFPEGKNLKNALAIVRKIFPFRDTKCVVYKGRACFSRQIGLCPGVCTGEVSKDEYGDVVRNIVLLFSGKKKELLKKLERDMKHFARAHEFKKAIEVRKTLFALKHIQDISLLNQPKHGFGVDISVDNQYQGQTSVGFIHRIEAYDVAHMGGKEMVGVMTVLEGGEAQKNEYRKFNVRTIIGANDTGALQEVFERRLRHTEWPPPQLIVVDGGKAQVNVVKKVLKKFGAHISVVGVVKDDRHRPKRIEGERVIVARFEREILVANGEAHRFAIAFHRKKFRINN